MSEMPEAVVVGAPGLGRRTLIPPILKIPLMIDFSILLTALTGVWGAAWWVSGEIGAIVSQNELLVSRVDDLEARSDKYLSTEMQLQVLQARVDNLADQVTSLKPEIMLRFDRLEDRLEARTNGNGRGGY